MKNKIKFLAAASIFTASLYQFQTTAVAHIEPEVGDGMEKCYGVAKAHKNDCASKAMKHSCVGLAKKDRDPNEWIKVPEGLCDKLAGGSKTPSNKMPAEHHDKQHKE